MHSIGKFRHILSRAGAILLAAGVCFGLLALAGCGKDDGAGKVVNYPVEEAPRRLDPAVARSASELLVVGNCMEGLVREDAEGKLVPGVAERWETSPDGKVLTFFLRRDNAWRLPDAAEELLGEDALRAMGAYSPEEGSPLVAPVTAEDFVFGLRRALRPGVNAPGAALLLPILNAGKIRAGEMPESALGVQAAGRLTLEIALESPGEAFLHALARGAAMPCSQAYFEACGGRYGLEPKYLPCNGPFYLDRMGDTLTRLRPHEGYRDGEGEMALPARVDIWTKPDERLRAQMVGTEYDAAIVPERLEGGLPEGVTSRALKNATLALVFNCGAGALEDVNVRAALCAALEPGALGIAPIGLLPDAVRAGGENYREAAGPPDGIKYDLQRAYALAESAGEKITLRLVCAPAHETLLRRALQAWQKVFRLGLEAQIEPLEPEDLEKRLAAGDFDIAVAGLRMEHSAAPEALRDLGGDGNLARFSSPTLDALLAAAARTGDMARACLQAEEHLLQNGVYYPLEAGAGALLVAPGVEGLEVSPAGDQVYFARVRKWEA